MATKKGIDVSRWQENVDFVKVKKAGYSFVMINAGYGQYSHQKDPYFETNYKKAKAAGLNVGAYWYSYAVSEAEALAEAKTFLAAIKGKQFDMPIAFDIEDKTQQDLTMTELGKIVKTFCGYCEKQGYYVQLYSYENFLNKIPQECRTKYSVWLAEFDVAKPTYKGSYDTWQYTSKGSVPGVSGNCDCNYVYKDFPKIIKKKGLNGYTKSKPSSVLPTLDKTGFKLGDTSNGVLALKELLIVAKSKAIHKSTLDENGVFGKGTLEAVNTLLGSWGYKQTGVAGENFILKLSAQLRKKL